MFLTKAIRGRITTGALLGAVALAGVTGCTATVTARPARSEVLYSYPVEYVDDAPPGVYDSPSVYYRGRPAYLVGARWYYPSDAGWVYFRDEPTELRRARTTRSYVRVGATRQPRYIEQRPTRGRYVEQPQETRRRRYD